MIETSRSKVFIGIQLLLGTAGVFGSTMQERSLQDSGIGSQALDTYQPRTIVTGEAAIDLDIQLIFSELSKETKAGLQTASRVYQEGAFSGPVAEIELTDPLEFSIPRGTLVAGDAHDGNTYSQVTGRLHREYSQGERIMEIAYDVSADPSEFVHCQVGARPTPELGGCFKESGIIHVTDLVLQLPYTYDLVQGNLNDYSLQKMSVDARKNMFDCENCPKPEYKKFVDYYGKYDYADHMIMAAFHGAETSFSRGNLDLRNQNTIGRREFLQDSMVLTTLWMDVIHQMESALDLCIDVSEEVKGEEILHKWDAAIAFYVGSTVSTDDGPDLLFDVANARCRLAGTCGESGDEFEGKAQVNYEVLNQFTIGQEQIEGRECTELGRTKEEIVRLMTIPLIQGTIRHAHLMSEETFDLQHSRKGTAYAAAVLPILHSCSERDAAVVHENMRGAIDQTVDFVAVRNAFVRNYNCLKVSCQEIGGIWNDSTNDWEEVMYPCMEAAGRRGHGSSNSSRGHGFLKFAYALGGLIALAALLLFLKKMIRKRMDSPENEIYFKDSTVPGSVPPPDDVDIIAGAEYVPKYWKDCEKDGYEDYPTHSIDDTVEDPMTGEII